MGMFVPEDNYYNETDRQVGFNRYKQLLGRHWVDWLCLNLLTLAGFLPLAAGIIISLLTSSLLLLIPAGFIGGAIFGPFLSCVYDNMLRAMRDDPRPWFSNFKKSWKQNFRGSLIPGGILGIVLGIYCFLGMMLWVSQVPASPMTIILIIFSMLIVLMLFQLYFTQLVLFSQSAVSRIYNSILFILTNVKRVFLSAFLQLLYWAIYVLFAPWTLLLVPVAGIWYISFLSELILYSRLDEALQIEERFKEADREKG